jgi:hypothetical protein
MRTEMSYVRFSGDDYWRCFRVKYAIFWHGFFLLIYELQNFQCFSKQFFAWDIDNFSVFFLKFECFQCKEGVIIFKMYRTGIVLQMYRIVFASSYFLFYILERWWFQNVKGFRKNYRIFPWCFAEKHHSCNPPPPNEHMTFIVDIIYMRGFPYSTTHHLENITRQALSPVTRIFRTWPKCFLRACGEGRS